VETLGAATEWHRFEITTRVTLLDASGAAQLWLPLAQTAGSYQTALDLRWQSSGLRLRPMPGMVPTS
jgi:hypothetical protein